MNQDSETIRGCRVRICIFATTTWPDIYRLLTTIITISLKLKVRGVSLKSFDKGLLDKTDHYQNLVLEESRAVDQQLLELIGNLRAKDPIDSNKIGSNTEVIEAGVQALHRYGIGPCSARWFYGSFDTFVHLEQRLAKLYPSLVKQSGRCRG